MNMVELYNLIGHGLPLPEYATMPYLPLYILSLFQSHCENLFDNHEEALPFILPRFFANSVMFDSSQNSISSAFAFVFPFCSSFLFSFLPFTTLLELTGVNLLLFPSDPMFFSFSFLFSLVFRFLVCKIPFPINPCECFSHLSSQIFFTYM